MERGTGIFCVPGVPLRLEGIEHLLDQRFYAIVSNGGSRNAYVEMDVWEVGTH